MFARFFIDRPVFAWVISIIIMLTGIASIMSLPVAQYPTIAPPVISVSTSYTGADAETVENSVTQILEQQLHTELLVLLIVEYVRRFSFREYHI